MLRSFIKTKPDIYSATGRTRQKRATIFLTKDQAHSVAKRCLTPHQARGVNCFSRSVDVTATDPCCCRWKLLVYVNFNGYETTWKHSPVMVKMPTNKPIDRPASITSSSESFPSSFFRPAQIPTPKISK